MSGPRKPHGGDIIVQVRSFPEGTVTVVPNKLPLYYKGRTSKDSTLVKVRLVTEGMGPHTSVRDLRDCQWSDGTSILEIR